jgi:vitamin B12 transporter
MKTHRCFASSRASLHAYFGTAACTFISTIFCTITAVPVVLAQTPAPANLEAVVVTATRTPINPQAVVNEVVVIDRAELDRQAGRTLAEILSRSAGVQFSSNGGSGKASSIYLRGTEARHTILLIDGVRYGSATLGTPIWDTIPLESIERIEVVKGPASSLYGSDGVGGVVQIITRQGAQAFRVAAKATVGSNAFSLLSASVGGSASALTYHLDLSRSRDKGFSATNPAVPFGSFNADKDGYAQDAINANLTYQLSPQWKLQAGLLYSDGLSRFDDGPSLDSRNALRTESLRLGVEGTVMPNWTTSLRVGQSTDTSNAILSAFMPSNFKTQQNQVTWQNNVKTPLGIAILGLEQLKQSVDSSTSYTVSSRTVNSLFAGLQGDAGGHAWQANVRRDSNSQFGRSTTGFAGYAFSFTPALRLSASAGTSFVAPSFNQLYFPNFGNPLLQPEKSKNIDLALQYSQDGHRVKIVRFDNKIRGFITSTTVAANIPRARIDGWSLGYDAQLGNLALRASVDSLNPRNELTGKQLARRNTEQISLAADYQVGAWQISGNLLKAGARFDNAANTVSLNGYTVVDVGVTYRVNQTWKVEAKVNNLTDQDYQTILGYNQPGRLIFFGASYQAK